MGTIVKLDQLAEFRSQRDNLGLQQDEAMKAAYSPELIKTLACIEEEFFGRLEIVNNKIDDLQAEIKADVLGLGSTVHATYLQAVWNKGRVSWNTKSLDGYLVAHPELEQFRKQGKPSVSIRERRNRR